MPHILVSSPKAIPLLVPRVENVPGLVAVVGADEKADGGEAGGALRHAEGIRHMIRGVLVEVEVGHEGVGGDDEGDGGLVGEELSAEWKDGLLLGTVADQTLRLSLAQQPLRRRQSILRLFSVCFEGLDEGVN